MQLLTDHGVPNVAKVASKDQARPVLTCCYLDAELAALLEATDSQLAGQCAGGGRRG